MKLLRSFALAASRAGRLAVALACVLGSQSLFAQGDPQAFPAVPVTSVPTDSQALVSHLDLDNYKLSPGDSVGILVYQEEDMTTQAHITKEGTVTVPLIGQIKISGLTPREAQDTIRDALISKKFLVNPRVTVVLEAASQKAFIILGQVAKPGTYNFSSQETVNLVQAIALAGGLTRIANPHDVTIVRREGGSQQNFHVDAKKMTMNSQVTPFEIKSGDIITVGETFF